MTTATITVDKTDLFPSQRDIGILPEQEDFNSYWVEYCRRNARGFNITALPLSPETAFKQPQNTLVSEEDPAITEPKISPKNLEAIRILNQWFAEPDDLGEEFWDEFCEDLEKNRFTI